MRVLKGILIRLIAIILVAAVAIGAYAIVLKARADEPVPDEPAPDGPHVQHNFDTTIWKFDTVNHWHPCIYGCNFVEDLAAHKFENGKCTVCGAQETHVHKFDSKWKYAERNHWHECECGTVRDMAPHTFENGKCIVCGATESEEPHVHTFDTTIWVSDNTNHWHPSTCGHNIVTGIAPHTFENGKCKVCGTSKQEESHVHTYNEDEWGADALNHWHFATCGHDVVKDRSAHVLDGEICKICGYDTHEHSFNLHIWKYSNQYHWHEARCGHDLVTDKAEHTIENGLCTVCNYRDETKPHTHKPDMTRWKYDKTNHYHKCVCGYESDKSEHIFEQPGIYEPCVTCGVTRKTLLLYPGGII